MLSPVSVTERPQRRLIGVESGGFRLECANGSTIAVSGADGANRGDEPTRTVSGAPAIDGWRMTDGREGVRVERQDGREAGHSVRSSVDDDTTGAVAILLDDGRLFRIAVVGPRDARFELRGWETRGAYFPTTRASGIALPRTTKISASGSRNGGRSSCP